MDHGFLERKKMTHLQIPLSDQEEAILELLKKVNTLEHENYLLKGGVIRWKLL